MTTVTASSIEFRKPRKRIAIGPPRPSYLQSRDLDKLTIMLVALMGEVSTLRDRIDTSEALAAQGLAATDAAIEAFQLTPERAQAREARREAMMNRVFRVLRDDIDALPDAPAP
jgi:hypothetical protein